MATRQFNLRLRDGLDQQVRMLAATHGVDARVVVEDALIGHFGFTRQGDAVDPHQLALPANGATAADETATLAEPEGASLGGPQAPSGRGCPECGAGPLVSVDGENNVLRCPECGYRVQR